MTRPGREENSQRKNVWGREGWIEVMEETENGKQRGKERRKQNPQGFLGI